MAKVRLLGELEELYGKEHELFVRTPRELMSALEANFPGITQKVAGGKYTLVIDGEEINEDSKEWPFGDNSTVDLVPATEGHITGPMILNALISVAVSYVIYKIADIISPTPQPEPDVVRADSHLFSSTVNSARQGDPVPVVYGGPILVGSRVVSTNVLTHDTNVTSADGGSFVNGYLASFRTPTHGDWITLVSQQVTGIPDDYYSEPFEGGYRYLVYVRTKVTLIINDGNIISTVPEAVLSKNTALEAAVYKDGAVVLGPFALAIFPAGSATPSPSRSAPINIVETSSSSLFNHPAAFKNGLYELKVRIVGDPVWLGDFYDITFKLEKWEREVYGPYAAY
jgi:predicted phage tail protein